LQLFFLAIEKPMIQPKNIVINIGLLLDAIGAEGGIKKFARKCRVDTSKINMLLSGEIPNPGPLWRICQGAHIKPSELIVNAATHHQTERHRGKLLSGRWPVEPQRKDAG
jgi:hypothetical protein